MKLLSALLVTACLAAPLAAQNPAAPATAAADVLGTWNATFTTQQGQIPAQIKLDKTGDKITGTIASQMGESKLEAEVKAKAVSMWFTMSGQNGPIAIELLGTVEGDTLKGTATAEGIEGGEGAGAFHPLRIVDRPLERIGGTPEHDGDAGDRAEAGRREADRRVHQRAVR
jgi:hypothetical protein